MAQLDDILRGRYRLDAVIGRGGHGQVFRGWDLELERVVAVKVLRSVESSDRTGRFQERFRAEAKTAARISHPNVITIHDVSTASDDSLFIVMEYLEGRELTDELAELGCLELRRAIDLFVPCLEGLGAGHQLGIVHKDIKPANLLLTDRLTRHERLRVIDFGVAHVESAGRNTATGTFAGTPRYAAPEYVQDEGVTPAIDVYQMGLVLAECVTGVPAVPRGLDQIDTMFAHVKHELQFEESVFTGAFGRVLKKAMDRAPLARYQNGTEMAEALANLADDDLVAWERANGLGRTAPVPAITPAQAAEHGARTPSEPSGDHAVGASVSAETNVTVADLPSHRIAPEEDEGRASRTVTVDEEGRGRRYLLGLAAVVLLLGGGGFLAQRLSSPVCDVTAGFDDCSTKCRVDLRRDMHNCPADFEIEFTDTHRGTGRIELPSSEHMLIVDATICDPTEWVLHVGDSPTNDGGGGDLGDSSYDAELTIFDDALGIFGNDVGAHGRMWSASYPAVVAAKGCETVRLAIADAALAIDPPCRPHAAPDLLRLDPASDPEGTPDRVWYLGFNRTYRTDERSGSGAQSVELCVTKRPDDWPPEKVLKRESGIR